MCFKCIMLARAMQDDRWAGHGMQCQSHCFFGAIGTGDFFQKCIAEIGRAHV